MLCLHRNGKIIWYCILFFFIIYVLLALSFVMALSFLFVVASWNIQTLIAQIYPYLVVNDACLTESRREERVLQLLRMLNHFLTKQKVSTLYHQTLYKNCLFPFNVAGILVTNGQTYWKCLYMYRSNENGYKCTELLKMVINVQNYWKWL